MADKYNMTKREQETGGSRYPASPFRMFEDFFNDWAWNSIGSDRSRCAPAVDILDKDGSLVLRMELPGLSEKDIDIKVEGSVLTVSGERKNLEAEGFIYHKMESPTGPFTRSFTLPETVDLDSIKANCKNGVLIVTLAQKPEVKPRTIKIST
jgi:HSP20 family protein